jgi:PAS domain S-box-containing protein
MKTDKAVEGIPLKALSLEDSARDFEIISEQLTDAGYILDISRVEKEEAFVSSLRANRYDIILADFKLPGFDAFGALRLRNEICPEIPFICVSGSIGEETAIELMKLGAVDYVLKEKPERLPLAIKRALREARENADLKKSERELRESEKSYRELFDGMTSTALVIDFNGNIIDVNRTAIETLGYSKEALLSIGISGIDSSLKGEDILKMIKAMPLDKKQIFETSHKTKDGRSFPVEIYSSLVFYQGSDAILSIAIDISESKQSQEALQEANRKLLMSQKATLSILEDLKAENQARRAKETELQRVTMAIEQTGEVVFITDADGTIQYVNPAFETVTGYTCKEALGRNPRMLKSGKQDQAFYRELWETISGGRTWKGRIVNRRKDDTLYTEESTISPVFDETGRIINYVTVKRDITEYLALTAQFEQAQKMESVGRLAGGVAHDYNNMLSIIIGYTELAMDKVDASDPLYADLQEVCNAASRSADITRQLLAFARKQTVAPVVLDLNETVEGMLKMLRRLIGEDIDLFWQPESGLNSVKMDPSQLDQILANLCVNARDAINGVGKLTIETANVTFDDAYCARHRGFIPGAFVLLAVSDNGCGMDKETLEHIFEPFFTTKGIGKGTGLGLATVYGIIKQNRGFINVYSEPDNGTTFKIYLPRDAAGIVGTKDSRAPELHLGRGETVLLVEDESALLVIAKRLMESLGYAVLGASGPGEALRLAEEHTGEIHLLLTDVVMPEMNGRDLAHRLSVLYPKMKCLFMSGYTANVIAHQGVLDEGVHFIQKPLSINNLAAKVREALDTE